MKAFVSTVLLLSLCIAGFAAQSTSSAQISGAVKDTTGGLIPGAQISVTQTDTGITRTTQSAEDGTYVLPNLPVGPYRLEVTRDGFNTFVRTGIVLQVAASLTVDASLTVGAVSEEILVEAAAEMVETRSNGVGQVVDQARVVDLPLNGRQATQLITLAGAAVNVPKANLGQLNSGKNYPNEAVISVAGGMSNGLTYVMDGGTYNDPINNANLPFPFPDALQEFKVETSALPAQYGHHSSGAVNVVTKSGGNEFHGNAFEFLRNGYFNARDSFASSRDSLKRNQFGGTIGGPILRNKLFFFGGFQATTQRSAPTAGTSFIPTPQMLAGDFTTIASPACNGNRQITLRAPFENNRIDPSQFSAPALKMLTYGYGSTSDPCGKVQFGSINNLDEQMGVGKVDYHLSSTHSIFYRHLIAHTFQPPSYTGTPLSITLSSPDAMVNSAVLGDTMIFGPNVVNSFRATFNRTAVVKTQVPFFGASDLGIKNVTEFIPSFLQVMVSGALYSAALQTNPGAIFTNTYQFADDITWVRGSHQIQFGANYVRPVQNATINFNSAGSFTFDGSVTGLSMADFLIGSPSRFAAANINKDLEDHQYLGVYAQDSWRVTPRLTMNYGLRWEPYFGAVIKHGWVSHFERSLFDQNIHSKVYPNAPAGMLYPGDEGFDTGNRPSKIKWNNFAPRVGFVWDPTGSGRMTVRASWGMFYDLPHTLFYYSFSSEPPWGQSITLNRPAGGFSDPWLGYPGGNPFPVQMNRDFVFPTAGYFQTAPLDLKNSYLQQWNLSIQRQLGANWVASASYLGNNTIHLWTNRELNPSVYIPGNCVAGQYGLTAAGPCSSVANSNARSVLALANPSQGTLINRLELLDDGGTASYQALLLSLQHRLSSNFTVLGNYTWSHCISDLVTTALGGPAYTNPNDRRADRGACAGVDVRHNANISAVVEVPRFANRWVQRLAGDWRISGIVSARTGNLITVTTGQDNALTAIGGQRPNQVLENAYCAERSRDCWINALAFAAPATGTLGNVGVGSIESPGYFNIDVGLSRRFPIRETQNVEIRAEAFNIENRVNLGPPTTGMNSATFGKILSGESPRVMQFVIKYQF